MIGFCKKVFRGKVTCEETVGFIRLGTKIRIQGETK